MTSKLESFFRPDRAFIFLLVFRWAALLPALWVLIGSGTTSNAAQSLPAAFVFGIAVLINLAISFLNRQLNQMVINFPAFMGADLIVSAGILAASGGSYSPYYLYALSPLLAGAFFFQMRGALTVAAIFTPLYLAGNFLAALETNFQLSDSTALMTELAGIWLIPILFAYPSTLLKVLNHARDELADARDELARKHENLTTAHRQLEIIHDLTVLLQAAPDLISVQERVLGAVTADLGFSKAIVALADPAREELGDWKIYPPEKSFPYVEPLPLVQENGQIFQVLLDRNAHRSQSGNEFLVQHPKLNDWLNKDDWFILPLYLREHPVGVLLVSMDRAEELSKEREATITTVANQAALALGTTILCIDRARRLAVEQERNRIARDIHDTVAQSLFGIVYSLDACINMLPAQADSVRDELIELRTLAGGAHDEVRRSIFDLWPSALTLELFTTDLTNYVNSCCRPRSFQIAFKVSGDFNSLVPSLRRTIYRITQEALANSARHSGAPSAEVCMRIAQDGVYLSVADEGRGFDPVPVLSRNQNREHFGLRGIQERVNGMGGECEIISSPGEGTRILIDIPITEHKFFSV